MMREEGRVVALDGAFAIVRSGRKSACGSCHAESSCSTLSGGRNNNEAEIRAHNAINAEVGDRVVLELREGQFLKAASLTYGMPLVSFFVVGIGVRALLQSMGYMEASEGLGALAGLLSLVGSLVWLRGYNRRIENDLSQQAVVASLVPDRAINVQPVKFPSCSV
ncbi:MAG: SoxR reducing system RseC family protein [Magnetococcales bacterium]|nr:SoxR reducing system RseC family protein [Magnetococcales bacterium]